jgi:HEAT repeat protein
VLNKGRGQQVTAITQGPPPSRASLLPLFGLLGSLALMSLCGCASFWDEVTSKDFKFKDLYVKGEPMEVLRTSTDGDRRADAIRRLKEPKQNGGSDQEQDEMIDLLAKTAASDKQVLCRMAAIRTLGRFKDPRAAKALQSAYDQASGPDTSVDVRTAAYTAGAGNFVPENSAVLRCHALIAMGETKDPATVDLLVRVLKQPPVDGTAEERQQNLDERIAAARALGNFSQPQVTEALLQVLKKEKDVALRYRAHESLQSATGKRLPPDPQVWEEYLHQGGNVGSAAPKSSWNWFGLN